MNVPEIYVPGKAEQPRLLMCTPEVTDLPEGMGNLANLFGAKAGGLADISAALIHYLHEDGYFQLGVTIPQYSGIIRKRAGTHRLTDRELQQIVRDVGSKGLFPVKHSAFADMGVYEDSSAHNTLSKSLAFQQGIINNVVPQFNPDIVHVNDYMVGLLPAALAQQGIRSLMTIHNIFTAYATLHEIDKAGMDLRSAKNLLWFQRWPQSDEDTYWNNKVDFLASGILAADHVNTVSGTFLEEIVNGEHEMIPPQIRAAIRQKYHEERATGILNAPDSAIHPRYIEAIHNYDVDDYPAGKAENKKELQEMMGLQREGPILLWPNRLYDQKGVDIFLSSISTLVEAQGANIAVVANGEPRYERILAALQERYPGRVARTEFSPEKEAIAKAGSDFLLMPSRYEPCGLPQMEGPRFGTLPIVRRTGGLADTVQELDVHSNTGNGFLFGTYSAEALLGATLRAITFYHLSPEVREPQTRRIMVESVRDHSLEVTAKQYVMRYKHILSQPRAA